MCERVTGSDRTAKLSAVSIAIGVTGISAATQRRTLTISLRELVNDVEDAEMPTVSESVASGIQ